MKLLTLDIKNIASLVEASIDFSSPELMSEPIFLVTGKTGSGKTSILNSICIALYNQVPALDDAGKDEDNHGVKIGSPLQLVRRNCKEASITLTFSDKEDTHYTVDWRASRVTRGANKGEFNKSAIQRTLAIRRKDGSSEHYSKLGEVASQIERALGLTFEQFCRTTMLAQGQFLKFINSDKKNKSEILEKITGTEIYSQVGRRVYAITKEHKDRYNALYNQIAGAQLFSDEEKEQISARIECLAKSIEEKAKAMAEIEAHEKWLESVAVSTAELEKAKTELATATSEEKTLAVKAIRDTITEWDETAEIRGIIADGLKSGREFADANDKVAARRPKFSSLTQGLSYVGKSIEACRRQIAANAAEIDREKQYAPVYAAEGQAMALIGVIEDESEKIKQCEQRVAGLQESLSKAKTNLDDARNSLSEAQQKLDEQQAEVDRIAKAGEGIDAKAINQKKNAAADVLDHANKALTAHKAFVDSKSDHEKKVAETHKVIEQLYADKILLSKAIEDKESLRAKSEEAAARLRGQMDLSERLAELTRIFKDSRSCPLCGSEVEHLHTKDFIDQAVGEARVAVEKIKKAFEVAFDAANDFAASVKSHESNLKKANAEAEKLQLQTELCRVAFEAFGIPADELNARQEEAQSKYDSLSDALTQALNHVSALKAATDERDRRRKAVEAARSRADKAKTKLEDIEVNINKDKGSCAGFYESMQANIGKLERLVAQAPHPDLVGVNVVEIKEKLPKLKAHYDSLITRSVELADGLARLERTEQEVVDKLALVEASFGAPDPMAEPCECPNIVEEAGRLSAEVIRLCGQIDAIGRRRKELADKEEEYFAEHSKDDTMAAIGRLDQETVETIVDKRKQVSDYAVGVANLQGRVEQLADRMSKLADSRPASLPDDMTLQQATAAKVAAKMELDELTQQKAKDASRLEQNDEREKALARLRDDCERAKKEYYKWECLNKLLGTESGDKFRNLAQSYIFGLLLRSANRFMAQLTDRYTLEGEVGSLVIYVIDHHDGGNKRVAKGLSGGEGFMASLALALALSAINQDLDPLDILFIDEGFGALDPTAREFTIDMLCSLQRRVCVISHMPELRECIPTQIVVTRQPGTSRATVELKTNQ
ncbi:MAG: SMC family ATPase [Muribaculaceae bacterium]|nr:SMC family ATPase [Muribaculaceae bacterium]